jgi:pilus assembly protein CpaB
MSMKTVLVVILALACGVSVAIGVSHLRQPTETVVQPEMEKILVAAVEIPRGRVLTSSDLKECERPKEAVLKGTLTNKDDALDRAAMIPILAGEPILGAKLAAKDAGRGLAALVPKGMRAYTIQASKVASSVAGFVLPGNRVDVLMTLRGTQNDETGGGSTTTLLQSVEILAVDQRLDAPADNRVSVKELSSVTLLVTPEQAALLDLGQTMGQLTLSLRNPEDNVDAKTQPATLASIRFKQEKPPAPDKDKVVEKPAPPPKEKEPEVWQIVTLRGNQRGSVPVIPRE